MRSQLKAIIEEEKKGERKEERNMEKEKEREITIKYMKYDSGFIAKESYLKV